MNARIMKKMFLIILLSAVCCQLSVVSSAEVIQPNQADLAIARGCYLYDSGRLKEALAEFTTVLKEDPQHQAALEYTDKIWSRLNEGGISSQDLDEEVRGYKNAALARKKIEITDQEKVVSYAGDKPYERFINTTSFGYNDRRFATSSDKSFTPDGFFIAERVRLDTNIERWRNTISLDARYHDNDHEDARLRRFTYALSEPGGMYFIAGDTSTRLSRYTLRGMYYRGLDFAMKSDTNEFKILVGAEPHFLTKTQEHTNRDNGYIYPRKVFAVRDAYKVMEDYKVGVSFMELRDSERVRTIDPNYNPKLNRVVAFDQNIEAVPGIWRIETENAYSTSDEDRTDKDILIKEEKLKDFAHYIRSALEVPKFRLINSYERIGSDFRSYADLASTSVTWLSGLTSDREKIDNYLEYRPFEFDPVYLDFYFSRIRSNLDKDNDIEMNQQTNYGTDVRFAPDCSSWLPQAAVRLKFLDTLGVAGSQYASNDVTDRDVIFELAKRLYGIDLNTSYTNRKAIENTETWGSYSNIYDLRMAKELTDMVLLSSAYSHSNTYKDQEGEESTTARKDYFNINTALQLWAGANLSFGYGYEDNTDSTGVFEDIKTNTYSTTFSWPFNKYILRSGSELTLAPYITYQFVDDWHNNYASRYEWTAAVDTTYQIAKDHRISLNVLYREDDQENKSLAEPAYIEDYRVLLTYQQIFQ